MGATSPPASLRRALRRVVACVACVACVAVGAPPSARASEPDAASGAPRDAAEEEARAAYDRGAAAYDAGDFAQAAAWFAAADAAKPNPRVLYLALTAAARVEAPALAMELVLRAESRAVDGTLAVLAKRVRAHNEGRVGYVRVACADGGSDCTAKIGDRAARGGDLVPVAPGEVRAVFGGGRAVAVDVGARATVTVTEPSPAPRSAPAALAATPPPDRRPEPRDEPRRLSPAWFFVGLGVTAVGGGLSAASAIDTAARHDAYLRAPSEDGRDRGVFAQTRTNVLAATTLVLAIVTAATGVWFTDWRGRGGDAARR